MDDRERRRLTRANWPVRKYRMGEEPLVDELDDSTAAERVRQVWLLTRQIWSISKQAVQPRCSRANMPGRIIRPDDRRSEP